MIVCMDCLEWLQQQPDNSVDLIFGSPPYEVARKYGALGFSYSGQEWVDWMVVRWKEMQRVSRGLVAMVVEGQTRDFRWSATPALLMADLHRAGIRLRKPPAYHRVGIPGSGGPDWLRNDYEFVICSSKGRLQWSDNTALGQPCKYGPGGVMSYRMSNDERVNVSKMREITGDGVSQREAARIVGVPFKVSTSGINDSRLGSAATAVQNTYIPPEKANPGNVITCAVGGGKMGSKLAHQTEAPFPERLAEFFMRSFCPPDGVVVDPFSGSGTTAAVAVKSGRRFVAIDIRQDQCDLTQRRIEEVSNAA